MLFCLLSSMAVEFPLVLYDCKFENIKWLYDQEVQEFNITYLQQQWANQAVKTHMLYSMLQGLESVAVPCETGMIGKSASKITGTQITRGCGEVDLYKVWR